MELKGAGRGAARSLRTQFPIALVLSYVFDWIIVIVTAGVAFVIGNIEPNKRPFYLNDPNISFPFTENESCPPWLLVLLSVIVPIGVIFFITLILVPGATATKHTPASLVWKRKLWELHVGWLGLALAVASAWFFTNGMKNMFGKPRPDLLARCQPDISRDAEVGGWGGEISFTRLHSASVCTQTDSHKLDDGFRSYPSGHSSSSAAGLVYLSLFLASKFGVLIPFVVPDGGNNSSASSSHAAFPSRVNKRAPSWDAQPANSASPDTLTKVNSDGARHNQHLQSIRRQAAAPPVYLLVLTLAPFCTSIWIAASRWYDFRHHGFDILFGWLMGLITAIFSFRYYHLSISSGAGWAWGPRSNDRAFWAGVGRLGYAADNHTEAESTSFQTSQRPAEQSAVADHAYSPEDQTLIQRNGYNNNAFDHRPTGVNEVRGAYGQQAGGGINAVNGGAYGHHSNAPSQDIEMQRPAAAL